MRFRVYAKRTVDHHVIESHHYFDSRAEAENQRIIEDALPGHLVKFEVTEPFEVIEDA